LNCFPGLLLNVNGELINGEIVGVSYRESNQIIDERSWGKYSVTTKYKANVGEINYTYQCKGKTYKKNKTILFKRDEALSFEEKYHKGAAIPLKINPNNCSLVVSEPNQVGLHFGPIVLLAFSSLIFLLCGYQLLIELRICKEKDRSKIDEKIGLIAGSILLVLISPLLLLFILFERKSFKIVFWLITGLLPAIFSYYVIKEGVVQEFRHKNWDDVTGTVISSSLEKINKTTYVSDGRRSRKEVYVYNGTVNYNYVCQGIAHSKVHNESANEETLNQFKEKYYEGATIELKVNPEECSEVVVYDTLRRII
jgi:hypothetical protein